MMSRSFTICVSDRTNIQVMQQAVHNSKLRGCLSVSVLFSGLFVAPPHLLSEAVTIMFSTITQSVTHISAPRITLKQINDAIAYKFPVYAFATLCYSHFIRDFF